MEGVGSGRARKAYKITKQREKWSDEEHARFVEAIEMYGRDWGKIVAHIGTRTVAQVRSHAQKFFLKLEKAGKADVVPPPRPKKRAAKPYPVQSEKSEEHRKSKRFRASSTATSSLNDTEDVTVGPSMTGTRSGGRSFQTSYPSGRPVRKACLARAAIIAELSGDLEGDDSNVASAHESNNEISGGPSANDNSGFSQAELDPNLMPSEGNMQGSAAPDYNKLFTVVGNVFKSGNEANHQQIMQQLEPSQGQGSHPQHSTASSFAPTLDSSDAFLEVSNSMPPRESLVAMMNKLTGELRNTDYSNQLQTAQQSGTAMPGTPQLDTGPVTACPPAQPKLSQLESAPSMALIPSSKALAVPASLTDEPLPILRPLPGSQGTALLQPLPSPYGTAEVQGKSFGDDYESLQNSGSLQNSSTNTVACIQYLHSSVSPPTDAVDLPLESDNAGQGSIAEQLLVNPNPRCMDDDLLLDVGPVLQMPEQADDLPVENTPLDNCLAQLTSETAPSLRIPGSDDFLDGWKISGNDPVWQSLDLKSLPSTGCLSLKPDDSSTFEF